MSLQMERAAKKRKLFLPLVAIIAIVMFVFGFSALAADSTSNLPGVNLTIQGVSRLVQRITCWVLQIILAIMVLALIIAGIRFFLARGEPAAVGAAKKNFTWVLAGIAVILGTNIIIATIAGFVYGSNYPAIPATNCQDIGTDVNLQE
jgi:hypothetical protein